MNILGKTVLGFAVFAVSFSGFSDDFEDLIQVSATLASNYNGAVDAPDTRYDQEYRTHLRNFEQTAAKVQGVIRNLELGQDFNFPGIANELDIIYTGNSGRSKKRLTASKENIPYSSSPEGILKMLQFDLTELRKMEFTTEDGGSIKASLETRRKLKEFDRLFNFFRANVSTLRKNSNDVSLRKFFNSRTARMKSLAFELNQLIRKGTPGAAMKYNLQEETEIMIRNFEELLEQENSLQKDLKKRKDSKPKTKFLDGKSTPTATSTEMSVSIRRIRELIIQMEQSGFESDPPLRKKSSSEDAAKEDSAAALKKESKSSVSYESMSEEKLAGELVKRRNEIFRGNTSMDGFDPQSERMYLLTLSKEQKKLYSNYLREFQKLGYSSGLALRSAILKIHTKLKNEKEITPSDEIVKILERLDKEEKKNHEEQDVKFEMKKGTASKL